MPKRTAAEIGSGAFDQPDLQIFFFGFMTNILGIWGRVKILWKGLRIPFQRYITCPDIFNIARQRKKEKNVVV